MKTLDEISAFWEALPGAARFANAYAPQIAVAEVAGVDARVAEEAAMRARARHRAAVADLRAQVEADAAAEWAPHEIEQARATALRCSLELAATTAEDVHRHRRLAREAIGF
jgi:hypothetical protein